MWKLNTSIDMLMNMYITLLTILIFLFFVILKLVHYNVDSNNYSIFECRFESGIRIVSYSLQFFTLALSFISFDFEIFLLLPYIGLAFHSCYNTFTLILVIRLLTLLLYVELKYMVNIDSW